MKKQCSLVLSLIMVLSMISGMTVFAADNADLPEPLRHPEGECVTVTPSPEYLTDEKALTAEDVSELDVAEIYTVYTYNDSDWNIAKGSYLIYINDSTHEALVQAAEYLKTLSFVVSATVEEPDWDISAPDTIIKEVAIEAYKDESNWAENAQGSGFTADSSEVSLYFVFTDGFLKYYGNPTEELVASLFPEIDFESIDIYNVGFVFVKIKNPAKESVIEACDYLNSFDFVYYAIPESQYDVELDPPFITGDQSDYYTEERIADIINNYHDDKQWYTDDNGGYVADKGIRILLTEEFAELVDVNSPWSLIFDGFEFESFDVSIDEKLYDGYYITAYPKNADKAAVIEACDYLNSLDYVLVAEPLSLEKAATEPVTDAPADNVDTADNATAISNEPTGDALVGICAVAVASMTGLLGCAYTLNKKKSK